MKRSLSTAVKGISSLGVAAVLLLTGNPQVFASPPSEPVTYIKSTRELTAVEDGQIGMYVDLYDSAPNARFGWYVQDEQGNKIQSGHLTKEDVINQRVAAPPGKYRLYLTCYSTTPQDCYAKGILSSRNSSDQILDRSEVIFDQLAVVAPQDRDKVQNPSTLPTPPQPINPPASKPVSPLKKAIQSVLKPFKPSATTPRKQPPKKHPVLPAYRFEKFSWPTQGGRITSKFLENRGNHLHQGIDIGAPNGTPIYAAADGVVVRSKADPGGFGWYVVIKHNNGVETWYGHMYPSTVRVKVGDRVDRGQHIANVGSNGRSSGPHLHFEVRVGGKTQNPLSWVSQ